VLTCEVCAAEFKRKRGGKNAGRCCSRACGFELQRRQRAANKVKTWQWRSIISYRPCDGCGKPITQGKRSKQVCNAACYRLVAGMTPRGSEVVGRCKCGGAITYTLTSMHRTHCDKCKRANAKARRRDYRAASRQSGTYIGSDHRKRARKYNVDYEPIQPRYIYERDNWTCHLCGERVHKSHPKDGGHILRIRSQANPFSNPFGEANDPGLLPFDCWLFGFGIAAVWPVVVGVKEALRMPVVWVVQGWASDH